MSVFAPSALSSASSSQAPPTSSLSSFLTSTSVPSAPPPSQSYVQLCKVSASPWRSFRSSSLIWRCGRGQVVLQRRLRNLFGLTAVATGVALYLAIFDPRELPGDPAERFVAPDAIPDLSTSSIQDPCSTSFRFSSLRQSLSWALCLSSYCASRPSPVRRAVSTTPETSAHLALRLQLPALLFLPSSPNSRRFGNDRSLSQFSSPTSSPPQFCTSRTSGRRAGLRGMHGSAGFSFTRG